MIKKFLILIVTLTSFAGFAGIEDLSDINNPQSKFSPDKSKKQFVMFWATWCGTCKYKIKNVLPEMNKKENLNVITVNIDKNIKRAKHYIDKYAINMPVYLDQSKEIINALQVNTSPFWAVYEFDSKANDWKLIHAEKAFKKENINKVLGATVL
ncbi:MAG: TlpA family protein disulfide reductase [Halobacteriovoraceae bacterium]|nr:TlpA family protein disulfide reductase [Halobacteriovoraceae bacterium]